VNEPAAILLAELAAVKAENKALRRRVRNLEQSRELWRIRARAWKWAQTKGRRPLSPLSPELSPP
jgi:hypothetical protein